MPRRDRRPPGRVAAVARPGDEADSPGGSALFRTPSVPTGRCLGRPEHRGGPMLPRSPWRTRGAASLVAVAVSALVLASAGPAAADPSDQPGGTSGVLDSRALDELQKRAAEVQSGLQAQQGEVVAARDALTQAQQ